MKTIILLMSFIFLYTPVYAFEKNNDYIPYDCERFKNKDDHFFYTTCLLAKKYQTKLLKTQIVYTLASIESSAFLCGYTMNKRFLDIKNKLLFNDQNIKILYDDMINSLFGNMQNQEEYCKYIYDTFGPNAPKGPNGGDNRLIE